MDHLNPVLLKCIPQYCIVPPLSSVQGKAIGVGIGCILGMFPLLFFKDDDEKKNEGQKEAKEKTEPPPAPPESSKN